MLWLRFWPTTHRGKRQVDIFHLKSHHIIIESRCRTVRGTAELPASRYQEPTLSASKELAWSINTDRRVMATLHKLLNNHRDVAILCCELAWDSDIVNVVAGHKRYVILHNQRGWLMPLFVVPKLRKINLDAKNKRSLFTAKYLCFVWK